MTSYSNDVVSLIVKYSTNTIGLVSALLVVLVMLGLRLYDAKLVNRVSLRIQWAIAFVDVVKHLLFYVLALDMPSTLCSIVAFMSCFFDQLYFMLNIAIVVNMQLMFINDKFPQPTWELRYWIGSFLGASIITIPPLGFWMYGRNFIGQCFISKGAKFGEYLTLFLENFMSAATLFYCSIVPVIILYRLKFDRKAFSHLKRYLSKQSGSFQVQFHSQLKNLIFCSTLYPLSCFISMIGSLVYVFYMTMANQAPPFSLLMFASVTRCLTGLFNLLAFSMDPTIHRAMASVWKSFKLSRHICRHPSQYSIPSQYILHQSEDATIPNSAKVGSRSPLVLTFRTLQNYLKST